MIEVKGVGRIMIESNKDIFSFANELVANVTSVLAVNLVQIVLYGSVARGENTLESDVDVAIIIKKEMSQAEYDKLLDVTVDLDLSYDRVFSMIDIVYDKFVQWGDVSPFYKNVKKDGIVLWAA